MVWIEIFKAFASTKKVQSKINNKESKENAEIGFGACPNLVSTPTYKSRCSAPNLYYISSTSEAEKVQKLSHSTRKKKSLCQSYIPKVAKNVLLFCVLLAI